jgi:class 3 adenylate cyclase
VNEAARLTEIAKEDPGRAVASEPTVRAAAESERSSWAPDDEVVLRGRDEPTRTWVRAGSAVSRR